MCWVRIYNEILLDVIPMFILEASLKIQFFMVLNTVVEKTNHFLHLLWSKMAFFKRAWWKVKVLSCP